MTRSRPFVLAVTVAIGAATPFVLPATAHAETTYASSEVQKHATSSDCWAVIGGGVYNLTTFIGRHEGGPTPIKAMCGLDGTVSYVKEHPARSGEDEPAGTLRRYRIGVLDPASVPAMPATTYTLAQVSKHDTEGNCWSVVNGKVYNLTKWVGNHQGGAAVIIGMCGLDGTGTYDGKHKGSVTAAAYLAQFVIGTLKPSPPTATGSTYTLSQVAAHGSAANCWSVVDGMVYNLTKWVAKHPGGKETIVGMCGMDGTAAYDSQHKSSANADAALAQFKVGTIGTAGSTQATSKTYTMKEVRRHSARTNCWSVVNGEVYNLTKWVGKHPGGKATIIAMCGRNGSKAFNSQHRGSATAAAAFKSFRIGRLV